MPLGKVWFCKPSYWSKFLGERKRQCQVPWTMTAHWGVHRNGGTHVYVIHIYMKNNTIERDLGSTKWGLVIGKHGKNSGANLHYLSLWGLVTFMSFITKNVRYFVFQDYSHWWFVTRMAVFSFWWSNSPALGSVSHITFSLSESLRFGQEIIHSCYFSSIS